MIPLDALPPSRNGWLRVCKCKTDCPVNRLRQTDVKAGHYERKVQALEQERDSWESKYEEMAKKYSDAKRELDEFAAQIADI